MPLLTGCAGILVSCFNGWLFFVDEKGGYNSTFAFDIFQGTINYIYLIAPTIYSLYRAITSRSRQQKEECWVYTTYMLGPFAAGVLESYLPAVPILGLSMFLLIQIQFLMIQNMQIYNDALTNLANRRHLNAYLEEGLPKASVEHPLTLFMIDVNGFKSVNDHYGHVIGDKALQLVADVLRETAQESHGFAARYGGDEFAFVSNDKNALPEALIAQMKMRLDEKQKAASEPFSKQILSISVGYVIEKSPSHNLDDAITASDRMLYKNKAAWHQAND